MTKGRTLRQRRPAGWESLRPQLTPFVNRENELATLRKLLPHQRLLSILGPAGIGKTRLVLKLAEESERHFRDGAALVELAPLTDGELILSAVLRAVELVEDGSRGTMQALEAGLASRRLLLVIDNCEHLVDQVAALLDRLLRTSPGLTVLTTSRDRLGVAGELAWRLPPLSVPAAGRPEQLAELAEVDSVALFLDRARRSRPDFAINAGNAADVAELMRRLEGLPLAIELAAAWTAALTPGELLKRLSDRFQLLVTRERIVAERHSSLWAAIDWSHQRLQSDEKALFRKLGLFAATWSLDTMTSACALEPDIALRLLGQLVDRSLVTVLPPRAGATRYRLPAALHDYAFARLREDEDYPATKKRFADHMLELCQTAVTAITGHEGPRWLQILDVEYDNVRVLFDPKFGLPADTRLRLATALVPYWLFRGLLSEGRLHLQEAVELSPGPTPTLVAALVGESRLAWAQGDLARAARHARRAFRVAREIGDRVGTAEALVRLAQSAFDAGQPKRARLWANHAQATAEQLGKSHLIAACALQLGEVELVEGRYQEAVASLRKSVDLFQRAGIVDQHAIASLILGRVFLQRGEYEAAEEAVTLSLRLIRPFAMPRHSVPILESLAAIDAARGNPLRAARLAGAAAGLIERIAARPPSTAPMRRSIVARWQTAMSAPGAERAWGEGKSMDLDEVMSYVLGGTGQSPGRSVRAASEPTALTSRQVQVARLVVQGLSNKEIASRLFISERTAEGHVEQILNKLGLNSRVQIAAWLLERDRDQ